MSIKVWLLWLIIVFQIGGSHALFAMPVALTEKELLKVVKAHYPLIQAGINNIEKARAEYLAAKGGFDPKIRSQLIISPTGTYQNGYLNNELTIPIEDSGNRLFTGYRIGRGDFPVYDQGRATYNYGEIKVGLEFPLLRDNQIDNQRAKIQQNQIRISLSEENYKLLKLETDRAAIISYWDWFAEGKKLLLQQNMLQLAQKRQLALNKSVQQGDIAAIEAIDNQRLIIQRQASLQYQKALFQKASYTLSLFYRDQQGKRIVAGINALPHDLNIQRYANQESKNTIQQTLDLHPEMIRLEKEKSLSIVNFKAAHNKLLPLLNNRVYLAQDFGGGNPPLNRTSINYELVFELPILQREAKGEMQAAQALIEKINNEQIMQRDRLIVAIKNALAQIKATQNGMALIKNEIGLATQVEYAENIRFQHGDSNLFLLNQREMATAEARARYIDFLAKYHIELANLRFASAKNT